MPTRAAVQSRNTMIDLLTRVPVNRGGLIKSIDHLLKTIETSENAVMIPTLLKDKVRVDAWELLFVAKILKASVLGHSDLVEFYLNHIHTNSSHANAAAAAAGTPVEDLGPPVLSPQSSPILRQQSSPAMGASPPVPARNQNQNNHSPLVENTPVLQTTPAVNGNSPGSSVASSGTSTTTTTGGGTSVARKGSNSSKQSTSSTSYTTATANSQQQHQQAQSLLSSPFASACNSITTTTTTTSGASSSASSSSDGGATCTTTTTTSQQQPGNGAPPPPPRVATFQISDCSPPAASPNADTNGHQVAEATPAVKPVPVAAAALSRHPQPPSLLQLTTTNNHINSVSEMFNNNSPLSPSLEQLTNHLFQLQQQSQSQQLTPDQVPLSISTSAPMNTTQLAPVSEHPTTATLQSSNSLTPQSAATTPTQAPSSGGAAPPPTRHELRSSRSAGCLFRANSGASSPRTTSGTPLPQAETLSGAPPTGLVGDPSSLIKLLLQVEQLKTSIVQVTSLLDSVVELYKKSIDNIAT